MRFMGKIFVMVIVSLALIGVPLFAQVELEDEIETPTPEFQDHGALQPWFWVGIQTVFSAGYNMETGAGGFRNYGGDNETWASFNIAFVDSHFSTPKFYEVPRQLDPDAWTGHFYLMNFTYRGNSYQSEWSNGPYEIENNPPAWLAEITGRGVRIGFFTQAAQLIGGVGDSSRTVGVDGGKPITRIYGGNKVINLGYENELGKLYYEKGLDDASSTTYAAKGSTDGGGGSAIMYVGYEKKELWNVFLTMLSEGNVNTDPKADKGFAGVVDFSVTPFGVFTDEEVPVTIDVSGNVIGGVKFEGQEDVGFGLRLGSGIWLGQDNLVLSPVVAFDGRMDNIVNEFYWKMGGGLTLQFSGMRWANDEWGDLHNIGGQGSTNTTPFGDFRYENNKILKYAYAQVYGAYSEQKDFNLMFRIEEPDGGLGAHEKLGAMFETRVYNLAQTTTPKRETWWEAQGRLSWDFNANQYLITPYIRAYANYYSVVKMRIGAYANIIPYTGFEICYTSGNLNGNAEMPIQPNAYSTNKSDMGRIELIVILKSDNIRPTVPKRMSDWNYPNVVNQY